MQVRILDANDNLFRIYTEDNYQQAMVDSVLEDPITGEITTTEVHIHPDDVEALGAILDKRRIDKLMAEAGISGREMRVWSANLSFLNLYLISRLIKTGEDTFPEELVNLVPLANQVIGDVEGGNTVISLLGNESVINKAIAFGETVYPILSEVLSNPTVPTLE